MKAALLALAFALAIGGPADAKTPRSASAKAEFKRLHPCPANGRRSGPCGGWVIDHVIPLACGGEDAPSNMQWQTTREAKEKDRWERRGCSKR